MTTITTIQVEVGNHIIDVTYDSYLAHDPFGEASYSIEDVTIVAEFSKEKGLVKHNIQESFRQALGTCLKDEVEQRGQHLYQYDIADRIVTAESSSPKMKIITSGGIGFNFLHELEESVIKVALMLMKKLKNVKYPYRVRMSLGISSY